MQRIIQRLKACAAMMSPNSNSDSSGDLSETRCDEETMRWPGARERVLAFIGGSFKRNTFIIRELYVDFLLMFY